MSLPDFRKLLNRDGKLTEAPVPLQAGDTLPPVSDPAFSHGTLGELPHTLFVFLSMTCVACIDLLPLLKEYSQPNQLNGGIVLMLNGYPDERDEVVKHFGFEFPVVLIDEHEMKDKYRTPYTPFAYLVKPNGLIVKYGQVKPLLTELYVPKVDTVNQK